MRLLLRSLLSGMTAFLIAFIIIVFAARYPLSIFVLGIVGIGILINIDDIDKAIYSKYNKHIF